MKKVSADRGKKLVSLYKSVFNSPSGKKVLHDLMLNNFVFTSTFSPDSNLVKLREGQRNAVLRIMTIIEMDPDKFIEIVNEEDNHV